MSEVRLVSQALTGSGLPVGLPDLGQLRLFPELFRVVGAVLDSVGLVPRVVADRTDVNIEGGTDHSTTGVLQNMGGVDCLGLIVVLQHNINININYQNNQQHSLSPCRIHSKSAVSWPSLLSSWIDI